MEWYKPGRHVVSAQTVGNFKNMLDEFMDKEDELCYRTLGNQG